MKKGDLVKLDPNNEAIASILEWETSNNKSYLASRPSTPEERAEWRDEMSREIADARAAGEDTFHIAMNDAGESRLPPRDTQILLPIDGIYIVERSRARVQLGWGQPTGGMTKILDTKTGEHAYVRRDMLMVIE